MSEEITTMGKAIEAGTRKINDLHLSLFSPPVSESEFAGGLLAAMPYVFRGVADEIELAALTLDLTNDRDIAAFEHATVYAACLRASADVFDGAFDQEPK